jgi:protease-4
MKKLFSSLGWLCTKTWRVLDGTRRALLNLLLLIVIVALVTSALRHGPAPLADKTILVLKLDGNLVEQFSGSPREQLMAQAQGQSTPRQTRLRDVLRALDAAATDPKISAVLLDTEDLNSVGMAGLHEVAAGIQRFKATAKGKPVLSYGERYSQRGYYLAAQADQIYLHPMGMVGLEGFGRWRTYYKDALDRLGVQPHVIKVGTYKSFAEPYTATGPSPATQEAEGYVYGELWSDFTGAIETARKLEKGSITQNIEALPQRLAAVQGDIAQLMLQAKLVDGLKTRDEMRTLLISKGAKDDKTKSFRRASLPEYLATLKEPDLGTKAPIGVVVAEGEIVDGDAGPGRVGGDSTARLIRQAREDEAIKAIVLRVNSPGGSAFASEIVRRELELTQKAGKPVVVSMGDVAASGGYWISMSSDAVIADPGTITGSIGVFGMLPTAEGLMDKLSLKTGGTTTTWLAGGYDPRRPLDPRLEAVVQSSIGHIYSQFTGRAATARKTTPDKIDAVAQGRIWTGNQAKDRGLIDRLGSFDDAIRTAAKLAKLELADGAKPKLRYVEKEPGRLERLLASLGDVLAPQLAQALNASLGPALGLSALPAPVAEELASLRELGQQVRDGRWEKAALVHCLCSAP